MDQCVAIEKCYSTRAGDSPSKKDHLRPSFPAAKTTVTELSSTFARFAGASPPPAAAAGLAAAGCASRPELHQHAAIIGYRGRCSHPSAEHTRTLPKLIPEAASFAAAAALTSPSAPGFGVSHETQITTPIWFGT